MAKLIAAKIDVTRIDKARLFKGKKGVYLDCTIALNDESDDYGNSVSIWQEQTKEEREAGEKKNFLGNGKVIWENDGDARPKTSRRPEPPAEDDDELPF